MSRPFVITGTGRSGTMWASEVLKACYVNCGHQAVFRHEQTLGARLHWGSYHGDSSFEAVPMLWTLAPRVLVVTLTREPLATLRSWRAKGLFVNKIQTWERWALLTRVLDKHFPAVMEHPDPMGRAALYWTHWLKCAVNHSHTVLRLEGLAPIDLLKAVDREAMYIPQADAVSRKTNANPESFPNRGPNTYGDIPGDVRGPLVELAESLGYD